MTDEELKRGMALLGAKDGDVVLVDVNAINLAALAKLSSPDLPNALFVAVQPTSGQSVSDAFRVLPKAEAKTILDSLIAM